LLVWVIVGKPEGKRPLGRSIRRWIDNIKMDLLEIAVNVVESRRMRWAGHVARMGEKKNVYRLLVGKPEGKRPLGRSRRRWIDNIKMDLLEIELNVLDWIDLALDRYRWRALVNSVMNLRVP
jgi:hypothetical protein